MSGLYSTLAKSFHMSEEVWRRHANPWSGWTRAATGIPLIGLAFWSRDWLGWGALAVIVLVGLWLWLNPRLFPPPTRYDAWMSKGVLGEKVFIDHRDAVPAHHRRAADLLAWASAPGVLLFAAGLWMLRLDWTVFGGILAIIPKLWFLDRMVWLLEDWQRAGGQVWSDE